MNLETGPLSGAVQNFLSKTSGIGGTSDCFFRLQKRGKQARGSIQAQALFSKHVALLKIPSVKVMLVDKVAIVVERPLRMLPEN